MSSKQQERIVNFKSTTNTYDSILNTVTESNLSKKEIDKLIFCVGTNETIKYVSK
jgi:predicted transcriptional regulator